MNSKNKKLRLRIGDKTFEAIPYTFSQANVNHPAFQEFKPQVIQEKKENVKTVVIKFDLIGAYKSSDAAHPQLIVEKLGMSIYQFYAVPVADCILMEVSNVPHDLPSFIELSDFVF